MTHERLPAIDWLKAIAILAVVLTHAGPPPWLSDAAPFDRTVRGTLAIFHVPTFLIVAGFLSGAEPVVSIQKLKDRLKRIFPPYFFASVVVFVLGMSTASNFTDFVFALLTGAALPIYYYVFVLIVSIVMTFVLTQLSARLPDVLLAVLVPSCLFVRFGADQPLPTFWEFRNPQWWYPYFLAGWVVRRHWRFFRGLASKDSPAVSFATLLLVAVHVATWEHLRGTLWDWFARALYTAAVVTFVSMRAPASHVPAVVRFLSDSSYTIYLYHYCFLFLAKGSTTGMAAPVRTAFLTSVGLAGSLAILFAGRRLFGDRSRLILGT